LSRAGLRRTPGTNLVGDRVVEAITGDVIECGCDVAVGVFVIILREVRRGANDSLDGSNGECHQSCKIITSFEEFFCRPVRLHCREISLNLLFVERVMLSERCRQLGWISEYLGPGLDFSDVAIHVLASV